MFEFPDKEKKTGKVGKVLRTGWKIGERVLRSATVIVELDSGGSGKECGLIFILNKI